jgi:hypothetical protein
MSVVGIKALGSSALTAGRLPASGDVARRGIRLRVALKIREAGP